MKIKDNNNNKIIEPVSKIAFLRSTKAQVLNGVSPMSWHINELQLNATILRAEFEFIQAHLPRVFEQINSNKIAIEHTLNKMQNLIQTELATLEQLIEMDIALTKINTYIAMGFLNEVEDNALRLAYLTRFPSLFFKLNILQPYSPRTWG